MTGDPSRSRAPRAADDATAALLARRARALAAGRDARHDAGAAPPVPVLVARRAGATFGVRAAQVLEVRRLVPLASLPGAERPVAGLAAWRGRSIVVHDPFGAGLAPAEGEARLVAPWLLVVAEGEAPLALLADDVDDVASLAPDTLRAPPDGAPPSLGATDEGLLLLDLRGWLALHSTT